MEAISRNYKNIMATPIASAVGGVAGYYATTKLLKKEGLWWKIGGALVGVIAGSMIAVSMNKGKTADVVVKK
jgi:outer membrane lipoprotein SlyB